MFLQCIARRVHVEVGPLWDNDHATEVGRHYELDHPGTRWNGGWNTTVWGEMSVLFITIRCVSNRTDLNQFRIKYDIDLLTTLRGLPEIVLSSKWSYQDTNSTSRPERLCSKYTSI